MTKKMGVGLVGYKFMGKSHSNAYRQVKRFFPDCAYEPELMALCGRDEAAVKQAAHDMGWNGYETDWKKPGQTERYRTRRCLDSRRFAC
jgi:predicted dehydrogenase